MESLFAKIKNCIKQKGIKGLLKVSSNYIKYGKAVIDEYGEWISVNEPDEKQLKIQREYQSCQDISFGIILEEKQEQLIKSIENQTYKKWNIIETTEILENTNNNDYIIWLRRDIELAPFALYDIVKTIEGKDGILYYSDHDIIIENKRKEPSFKPDFAIDTLLSKNYIGNMIAVKTKFLRKYPEILQNINDKDVCYDLLLKISEKTEEIIHIPRILYHELEENKINTDQQKEIIKQYLERNKIQYDQIQDGQYQANYKIQYKIIGNPKVSLVIPNKDHIEDLEKLMKSIYESTYENYEVIIVENNSEEKDTFEYYEKLKKENEKVKIENYDITYFNYSAIINFGVEKATGEYVILLNNDIEILTKDWIEQMLMYTQRKNVGICGIKLYFPDRSIQHAGVTIGTRGLAGHRSREIKEEDFKENDYINIVQDLSAVTAACFMVKKELYESVLGFEDRKSVV